MPEKIRLISLDLDDTLWAARPVLINADTVFYNYLQEHAPALTERLTAQGLREERLRYLEQHPEVQHYISRWRLDSLIYSLEASGYTDDAKTIAEQAFAVFLAARQQVSLFPQVAEVLAALCADRMLISLTNGNADLRAMPVSQFVTHSLRAEEFGASKPEPLLFEKALELAGCEPHEALHIGDHPIDDIEGARNLGIRSLQARLLEKSHARHQDAWGEFQHWGEVPEMIRTLEEG